MDYLHYEFEAGPHDQIEVTLDHPANVQLMNSTSYEQYRRGQSYHYHGGYVKNSPYAIAVPGRGRWHVVIDLGGGPGSVRASARLIPATQGAPA